MNAELVVMAAGMGSRFGGLKQAAPIGPNGEILIDFSVYDAVQAGFNKAVFIIRKDIEKDFREACGKRIEKMIDVEYVYQEKNLLPKGYIAPETREKPWGTGHAILCARDAVKHPFLVINADDYYGKSVYKTMYDFLAEHNSMCMAGYKLGNTLSDNGTVSRGICTVKDGYLDTITETHEISKDTELPYDTVTSMNMWGLDCGIFPFLEKEFENFLEKNINEKKTEFLLPFAVNLRIAKEGKNVKVLSTSEKWYGMTYADDTPVVREALTKMINDGLYDMGRNA